LDEETIKNVLKNLTLTQKEAEVYVFLSKHGVLKCNEIARGMKRHKAQIYRILKILVDKGLVESTLEAPARFTAVPFETVLDMSIRAKRDEAAQMETAKNQILAYWRSIRHSELVPSLEKFVVIEGNSKIYSKISQMIKGTKNQLSAISTVPGLMRADQFGIFETIFNHPIGTKIQFRFITDISNQGLNAMKTLLSRMPKEKFNIKGRNPDLGLQLAPRMIIKDVEEILFFITPRTGTWGLGQDESCLWTNCKELVYAFGAVFEDLWRNSTSIEEKIVEIEESKIAPKTCVISDPEKARKTYFETAGSAEKEIIALTSAAGLIDYWHNATLMKKWLEKEVSVKLMAPITSENLSAAIQLSKHFSVKHASTSHFGTTIIDGKCLFQFKTYLSGREIGEYASCFKDVFYTDDRNFVKKTQRMLDDIWEKAPIPSRLTLESLLGSVPIVKSGSSLSNHTRVVEKKEWLGSSSVEIDEESPLTEADLREKAKRYSKDLTRTSVGFGTTGQAVVRPPNHVKMPDLMIDAWCMKKPSTFGEGNALIVSLWQKVPTGGFAFVPVAIVETNANPKLAKLYQSMFAGIPAGSNVIHVTENELQVWNQGKSLFAGWTIDIPLSPIDSRLPPACLMFEAIGEARTQRYAIPKLPSGYSGTCEYTGFDAFVTFISPTWKYAGPATEAVFGMDVLMTSIAPERMMMPS
jgi:Sugar-specific transcriptional regulator TrmB